MPGGLHPQGARSPFSIPPSLSPLCPTVDAVRELTADHWGETGWVYAAATEPHFQMITGQESARERSGSEDAYEIAQACTLRPSEPVLVRLRDEINHLQQRLSALEALAADVEVMRPLAAAPIDLCR